MHVHTRQQSKYLTRGDFFFFFLPVALWESPGPPGRYRCCRGKQSPVVRLPGAFGFGSLSRNLFFLCETFLLRRGVFLWTTSVSLLTDKQVCRVFARALVFVFLASKGSYRASDFGTHCWTSRVIIISQGSDNVIGGPALSVRLELSLGLADAWSCLGKGGQDLCCAPLCNFADIARQVTTQPLDGAALVYC